MLLHYLCPAGRIAGRAGYWLLTTRTRDISCIPKNAIYRGGRDDHYGTTSNTQPVRLSVAWPVSDQHARMAGMTAGAKDRRRWLSGDFGRFWLGQTISNLGSSFTMFALPLLVFKLTGSPLNLAHRRRRQVRPLPAVRAGHRRLGRPGRPQAPDDRHRPRPRGGDRHHPAAGRRRHAPVGWIYAVAFCSATLTIAFDAGRVRRHPQPRPRRRRPGRPPTAASRPATRPPRSPGRCWPGCWSRWCRSSRCCGRRGFVPALGRLAGADRPGFNAARDTERRRAHPPGGRRGAALCAGAPGAAQHLDR